MCFHPEAGSILVEEIMRRGLCRKRKPFSGFASHWKPPLMPIEHSFRSNFIPSHCISLPHFPFTPLCLCQQVAHKHTCLPWSQGAAGQKAPSAAHLSPPPLPNQHCQTQLPAELTGWHSKWCVGKWGSLASCWVVPWGSEADVKSQLLPSWGRHMAGQSGRPPTHGSAANVSVFLFDDCSLLSHVWFWLCVAATLVRSPLKKEIPDLSGSSRLVRVNTWKW